MDVSQPIVVYEDIALNPQILETKGMLLHALLQSTDYGVLVSGLDRQDIIANRRLGELFKMPPQQVVETDPDAVRAFARSRVRDPHQFEKHLRRAYEDPVLSFTDEIELIDDPPVVLRRYTGPIYGPDGRPVARLWTFLDISETKGLQREVQAQLDARTAEYVATAEVLRGMNALCPLSLEDHTIDRVLASIVWEVRGLAGGDCAAVLLLDRDKRELIGFAASPGREVRPLELPYQRDGLLREVIDGHGAASIQFCYGEKGALAWRLNWSSFAVSPLLTDAGVTGMLVLGIPEQPTATGSSAEPDRLRMAHLQALVDQVTVTLRTHRLQSELRAAVETLQATQRRMVEMEKLRTAGTLAASVAHDIRNILTALQMELELHPTSVAEPVAEHLNRFAVMTHRLLAFSRMSVLETQPTSIPDVIRRIVPLIAGMARINAVEIRIDMPMVLPPVAADAGQLEHVFINLCLNAIQAMMTNGGTLTLSARTKARWLEIGVRDTGVGIPPNVIGRLFDPFFTTRETGTGLGLFSCKRIVEEHGGQITVDSRIGVFTCFTVLLPTIVTNEPLTD
jgi:signal transduction histidine kinase